MYHVHTGAKLVEDLVLLPDVRVRSWKLHFTITVELLRSYLLYVRQLPVLNIVIMASRHLTKRVLDEVGWLLKCTLCLQVIV